MNWTDDAYSDEHGPWTDEEPMVAVDSVARCKVLRRKTMEGDDDV